jgi:hypothetical protein
MRFKPFRLLIGKTRLRTAVLRFQLSVLFQKILNLVTRPFIRQKQHPRDLAVTHPAVAQQNSLDPVRHALIAFVPVPRQQ